jgi:DNA polymerase-3 subunit delta'
MRFSDIPDNETMKRKLVQTVMDQRVSHAQLFFGPENSPKLALAIAYAQLINCTNKQHTGGSIDACGQCPSCAKYQKLAHPDLHFIYPVATTKKVAKKPQSKHFIEDWRKFLLHHHYRGSLLDWYEAIGMENKQGIINADDCNEIITILSYKSYESDYKVMIIWMVEKLFHSAAPKLLKIFEEPPDKTLFILIAEETDQIINTILSRTLMVKIPGQEFTLAGEEEDESQLFATFRDWMRLCYGGKIHELVGFTSDLAKTGREKQKNFLHYALRTVGICSGLNYGKRPPTAMNDEEITFITRFAPYIPFNNLVKFNTLLNESIYHIERNAHPSTLFLDLSLKIVRVFKPNFVPLP